MQKNQVTRIESIVMLQKEEEQRSGNKRKGGEGVTQELGVMFQEYLCFSVHIYKIYLWVGGGYGYI